MNSTFTERVKIFSNFMTALGTGLIGFAFLRPLADGGELGLSSMWWTVFGLALHGVSHYTLGMLTPQEAAE